MGGGCPPKPVKGGHVAPLTVPTSAGQAAGYGNGVLLSVDREPLRDKERILRYPVTMGILSLQNRAEN